MPRRHHGSMVDSLYSFAAVALNNIQDICKVCIQMSDMLIVIKNNHIVSSKEWQTIRCVVSLCDTEIPNEGATGERYLYSEFIKDNIVLTIGAGDENPAFDTNRIPYGVEYVRKVPVDKVVFGVAWATDYEGQFDIRTQLATDLY